MASIVSESEPASDSIQHIGDVGGFASPPAELATGITITGRLDTDSAILTIRVADGSGNIVTKGFDLIQAPDPTGSAELRLRARLAEAEAIDIDFDLAFSSAAIPQADPAREAFLLGVLGQLQIEAGDEAREALVVALSQAFDTAIAKAVSEGRIAEDDGGTGSGPPPKPVISVAPLSADRPEGSGITEFSFLVTRSGDTGAASSMEWTLSGSGANPAGASDFAGGALPFGIVAFAPGESEKTITVQVQGDGTAEADEGFSLSLGKAVLGTVGTGTASGLIRNDDTDGVTIEVSRNGVSAQEAPSPYRGPVSYLQYQFLGTGGGEIVAGSAANDFMNLAGGDDAADGAAGADVLDGGQGSNFLSGGAGLDVFFLDGRSGNTTWSTITDWQAGEQLSIWGWRPGISQMTWVASSGAQGWQGVTMHGDLDNDGVIDTSVTWTRLAQGSLPAGTVFEGLLWFQ